MTKTAQQTEERKDGLVFYLPTAFGVIFSFAAPLHLLASRPERQNLAFQKTMEVLFCSPKILLYLFSA